MPKAKRRRTGRGCGPVPDPSPEQLAARVAAVRAGWTEKEERRRRGDRGEAEPWTARTVRVVVDRTGLVLAAVPG